MKRFLFFIILAQLFVYPVFASKIDSLKAVYKNSTATIEKYKLAIKIADKLKKKKPEKAIEWGKIALQHTLEAGKKDKEATANKKLGDFYKKALKMEESLPYYQKALQLFEELGNEKAITRCSYAYANALEYTGRYNKSHDMYEALLDLEFIDTSNWQLERVYHALTFSKILTCEYDRAMFYIYKLEDKNKETGQKSKKENIWYLKSNIFFQLKEYEKSETYLKKMYDYGVKTNNENVKAIYWLVYGGILEERDENYELAATYIDSCLQFRIKQKNDEQIGYSAIFAGHVQSLMGNFDKAKHFLDLANKKLQKLGINKKLYELYFTYCEYYMLKGNYNEAIEYGEKAISLHKQFGLLMELPRIYKMLSEVYSKKGNSGKAYDYLLKHINLRDSTLNMARLNSIKYLEMERAQQESIEEISKLQDENLDKDRELSKQRTITIFAIVTALVVFLLLIVLYIFFRQKRRLFQKEKEMLSIRSMLKGQEEERERIAKDLHDGIVSDLTGLRMYLDEKSENLNPDVVEKIIAISQEVRVISHNLSSPMFFESNFEEVIKNYIDQFTHSNNFEVKLMFYPQINWDEITQNTQRELYRIVQEIVNNTIKHAEASKITIQVIKHDDSLNLTIEDNGKGFLEEFSNSGRGIRNVKERISLLNGELTIESVPEKSTLFVIDIPLIENEISQIA